MGQTEARLTAQCVVAPKCEVTIMPVYGSRSICQRTALPELIQAISGEDTARCAIRRIPRATVSIDEPVHLWPNPARRIQKHYHRVISVSVKFNRRLLSFLNAAVYGERLQTTMHTFEQCDSKAKECLFVHQIQPV